MNWRGAGTSRIVRCTIVLWQRSVVLPLPCRLSSRRPPPAGSINCGTPATPSRGSACRVSVTVCVGISFFGRKLRLVPETNDMRHEDCTVGQRPYRNASDDGLCPPVPLGVHTAVRNAARSALANPGRAALHNRRMPGRSTWPRRRDCDPSLERAGRFSVGRRSRSPAPGPDRVTGDRREREPGSRGQRSLDGHRSEWTGREGRKGNSL